MSKINALKYKKIKELIHPLLIKTMKTKTTGELTVEGKFPEDENCLIVANHFCIEDIPTLGQAVGKHFYLLVSDEDKNTIDGLGLELNGVEWIHRTDKSSRIQASENIVEILKQGYNFAMYPEATWNLSPNLLMLPMNYGCIRMALLANVPIVPVVTLFMDDGRHTIIGDKFYPTDKLEDSIRDLRDIMATLIYVEIEKEYQKKKGQPGIYSMIIDGEEYLYEKRENISKEYWEENINSRYNAYPRAREDKNGVREFESEFIFTPNKDSQTYFQVFNSKTRELNGKTLIKRISSENNGYNNGELYKEYFEYGYNEKVLKRQLKIK